MFIYIITQALYSLITVYLLTEHINEMPPLWLNYHLGNATIIFESGSRL